MPSPPGCPRVDTSLSAYLVCGVQTSGNLVGLLGLTLNALVPRVHCGRARHDTLVCLSTLAHEVGAEYWRSHFLYSKTSIKKPCTTCRLNPTSFPVGRTVP